MIEEASVEAIARALNAARIRFLVVGGVAVITHGYLRLTRDVDLVVQLERDNLLRALSALATLSYQPRIPATPEQIADPAVRATWIRDKNMKVLNLFSGAHRLTPVDIFVSEPFDFDAKYERALVKELETGVPLRFVDIETLITMKRQAGRPEDLIDVRQLELRRKQ
jgi:predicted nucleotidyltransferase